MRRVHNNLKPGDRFGRLVILRERKIKTGSDWRSIRIRYECRCDCGTILKLEEGYRLISHKQSCGCLQRERASESAKKKRTHGFASNGNRIPEYMTWIRMRRRCENPLSQDYPNYGARGIRVCSRWKDFINFLEDMGRRPSKGYSIDRKDNDGNYTPKNCRWASIKQQNRNKRSIHKLTIDGVTKGIADWADESGVHLETIRSRIVRGWTDARKIVFGPLRQNMERVGKRWGKRK